MSRQGRFLGLLTHNATFKFTNQDDSKAMLWFLNDALFWNVESIEIEPTSDSYLVTVAKHNGLSAIISGWRKYLNTEKV